MTTVYALTDGSGLIRYIGATKQALKRRLSRHVSEKSPERKKKAQTPIAQWIRSLHEPPTIHALLEVSEMEAAFAERQFISEFKLAGHDLLNLAAGGPGTSGFKHKAESVARRAANRRGIKHTDEVRARMSKSHTGLKASSETKAKLSVMRSGVKRSEEFRASCRAAWVRRKAKAE